MHNIPNKTAREVCMFLVGETDSVSFLIICYFR